MLIRDALPAFRSRGMCPIQVYTRGIHLFPNSLKANFPHPTTVCAPLGKMVVHRLLTQPLDRQTCPSAPSMQPIQNQVKHYQSHFTCLTTFALLNTVSMYRTNYVFVRFLEMIFTFSLTLWLELRLSVIYHQFSFKAWDQFLANSRDVTYIVRVNASLYYWA